MRSMALTSHFSTPIVSAEKSSLVIKPFSKVLRLKQRHISVKKTVTALKIRSSFREKVFEDRCNGIICYADESGEIVCEGYDDEGPRYHDQIPRKSSHSRDTEIFDKLQQRWLNFVRGTELNPADQKGVAVQGDINCNGFNSFR
ncbi:hypothetical protein TIFTF001_006277 [Ficus carica]|uniref:Uncharacterized protein n=1 Tax=Ficus carica TaxID=3494 RepID=A0AA87ZIH3_FICCA|nr:hypothetical protein TIFTF001_006277 [Ficus carica]